MYESGPTYISRQVRGRGPGRRPSQHLFRDDHHQGAQAVHGETYPSRHRHRERAPSYPTPLDRNTYHEDYAEVERWSVIAETMSAMRLGVARHCGGTLEARGHGTCSHRGRLSRSASESSHRVADCHRAGQRHFLRAPVPTRAVSVPFLVPSRGRALGHGALARARARVLHNYRCQVPSVDGYESDWAP
jgi:hypothetical protein